MLHTKLLLIALLAIAAGAVSQRCPKTPITGTGGEVNGSVFYLAPVFHQGIDATVIPVHILLPDMDVYLHNQGTGVDGPPVKTDLYGRYRFPRQKAGKHQERIWRRTFRWQVGELAKDQGKHDHRKEWTNERPCGANDGLLVSNRHVPSGRSRSAPAMRRSP